MAVFSNDPRAQALWERTQMLNLIAKDPCPDTRQQSNDCQDYNRNVQAKSKTSAELEKYLKDTAKAKADAENKAADIAAEQRILDRRRQQGEAINTSCSRIQDSSWSGEFRAQMDAKCAEGKKNMPSRLPVTFAEIAAERGQSNLTGARAASGVARALAQPRPTPRPRLPRPTPAPRVPRKPVLRAKRVSSAQSA